MMSTRDFILLSIGMFAMTYPVRLIPLVLFNRMKMPPLLARWLRYVPLALFASILTEIVYGKEGEWTWEKGLLYLPALCVTMLVTIVKRSIAWGLILGYASFVLIFFL